MASSWHTVVAHVLYNANFVELSAGHVYQRPHEPDQAAAGHAWSYVNCRAVQRLHCSKSTFLERIRYVDGVLLKIICARSFSLTSLQTNLWTSCLLYMGGSVSDYLQTTTLEFWHPFWQYCLSVSKLLTGEIMWPCRQSGMQRLANVSPSSICDKMCSFLTL